MTQPRRLAHQLLLAACVLACAAPLTQTVAHAANWGWGGDQVQGNGVIKRQQRDVKNFTGVANGLAANVEVHIGATESVTIETDDNLLPLIKTSVEDGVLKIEPTQRNMNLQTKHMKIVVQAKSLDRLSLGGSGTIDSDALRAKSLHLSLGGSGTINLKGVDADTLSVNLGGSGDVRIAGGTASDLSLKIGGSGDVKMGNVRSERVSVKIAGSGQATVWARETLKLTAAGSGDVHYYGDPQVSKTAVGSGDVRRLGAAPK
jgi:hypothetical protein